MSNIFSTCSPGDGVQINNLTLLPQHAQYILYMPCLGLFWHGPDMPCLGCFDMGVIWHFRGPSVRAALRARGLIQYVS